MQNNDVRLFYFSFILHFVESVDGVILKVKHCDINRHIIGIVLVIWETAQYYFCSLLQE